MSSQGTLSTNIFKERSAVRKGIARVMGRGRKGEGENPTSHDRREQQVLRSAQDDNFLESIDWMGAPTARLASGNPLWTATTKWQERKSRRPPRPQSTSRSRPSHASCCLSRTSWEIRRPHHGESGSKSA